MHEVKNFGRREKKALPEKDEASAWALVFRFKKKIKETQKQLYKYS